MQIERLVDLKNRGLEGEKNFNYQLFESGIECAFLEQMSGNFFFFVVVCNINKD